MTRVWTYWEGPRNAMQALCEHSIAAVHGDNLECVSPENVHRYVRLPEAVAEHPSPRVRSDYVRAVLLFQFGGLWYDSDVLLLKDPLSVIDMGRAVSWREDHAKRKKLQGISIGAMYFPHPGHNMLGLAVDLFAKRLTDRSQHSMSLFHTAWKRAGQDLEVRDWREFYLVQADVWNRFWKESFLGEDVLGLHLWASAVSPGSRRYVAMQTVNGILNLYPDSTMADYIRRVGPENIRV